MMARFCPDHLTIGKTWAKPENQAGFWGPGSEKNSAKFWRHSAVSDLGSCKPCLFILHVTMRQVWKGNQSVPKTHQICSGQYRKYWVNEWTIFMWLSIKSIFQKKHRDLNHRDGTFSSISWIGHYNCLKITWCHALSHPWGCLRVDRLKVAYSFLMGKIDILKSVKLKQQDVSSEVLVIAIDVKCNFT